MKRRFVFLGILAGLAGPGVSFGVQPMFVVETAITAPSGDDWGRGTITTPLEQEAILQYSRGTQLFRLAIVVQPGSTAGCHAIDLQLQRTSADDRKQQTVLRGVACEGKPIEFDGKKLGAPSMTIALSKLAS